MVQRLNPLRGERSRSGWLTLCCLRVYEFTISCRLLNGSESAGGARVYVRQTIGIPGEEFGRYILGLYMHWTMV